MPITGAFYTRLSWSASTLDFTEPLAAVLPVPSVIAGANIADDGTREQLTPRTEYQLRILTGKMTKAEADSLFTWWDTWAKLGKQTAITLDRLATATGLWEYGQWNSFFSKAELLNAPFGPGIRPYPARALYFFDLAFRQGQ